MAQLLNLNSSGDSMHQEFMRDPRRDFAMPENFVAVTSLRVWYCKFSTMDMLDRFCNLRELVIAGFPDDSLDMLRPLKKLRYLSILHMPRLKNIDALSHLQEVECLSLATSPSWDAAGKRTIVPSLMPIARIRALKHLELFGVCPQNGKLTDLLMCKQLQSARFSKYPQDEVDDFYREAGVGDDFVPEPAFAAI